MDNLYNGFFQNNHSIMLIIGSDNGNIIDANRAACDFYQYSYEDMLQLQITDLNIISEDKMDYEINRSIINNENHFFYKHKLANGEIRDIEAHCGPITQNGKRVLYAIINDVTERVRAEKKNIKYKNKLEKEIEDRTKKLQEINDKLNKEVLENKRNMEKLRISEERLKFALDSSGDGVWDWNLVTDEVVFSRLCKEMLGYEESQIKNELIEWKKRIHPDDLERNLKILKGYIKGKIPEYRDEYRVRTKNGSYKWIMDRAKIISWTDEGKPLRFIGTHTDITDRKLMERQLKDAKEKAEKAFKNKSEFIANMSHELRTPLNVNLSAIQLFQYYLENDGILNKKKISKHLKSMRQSGLRLLRLVNNLIDTTKVDAGFYEPHFYNYNIVNIIERIAISVADYANSKDINLIFDTDAEEIITQCDVDMIERIMLNIISNAIKHTERKITINIYSDEKNVIITVNDDGMGLKEEHKDIIFQRYKQVSNIFARENEGTGLGLALTKSLVEMHGGSINVESEYGNGAEFIIKLPLKYNCDEKVILNNVNSDSYDEEFVKKMFVEFSDIYK
ncbi:hypothetical protein SH2C18_39030 [Clostridium sediminicola]|uniref:sensor histidine kinase n=1 Tax=Clostridium sediminicola TaxID=3114879 RepID=UPI0031F22562